MLTGEMTAELYVSSDAVDTDFMVRIWATCTMTMPVPCASSRTTQ